MWLVCLQKNTHTRALFFKKKTSFKHKKIMRKHVSEEMIVHTDLRIKATIFNA